MRNRSVTAEERGAQLRRLWTYVYADDAMENATMTATVPARTSSKAMKAIELVAMWMPTVPIKPT